MAHVAMFSVELYNNLLFREEPKTMVKAFLCSSVALEWEFWIWLLVVTNIVTKLLHWHYKNVIGSLGIL